MLYSSTHMATVGVKGLTTLPRQYLLTRLNPSLRFPLLLSGATFSTPAFLSPHRLQRGKQC